MGDSSPAPFARPVAVLGYGESPHPRATVGGPVATIGQGVGVSLANILWLVVAVIVVLWLFGLVGSIGGNLVHLLLVLAVIVVLYNLFAGRRAV